MRTEFQCQVAGCGQDAGALAPHHDPFSEVDFEQMSANRMTPSCHEHADVLWNFYRNRATLSLLRCSNARLAVSEEAIAAVAWTLNSHNDPLSKSLAALLAAVKAGSS